MDFESLYQHLAHGAEIVRALTAGISQQEAQVKPDPEAWSTLEVLCHLYDEEREDFRYHLDAILNRPEESWPPYDPQAWVTERGYNQRNFAEMVNNFLTEREQSLKWLKSLSAPNWEARHTEGKYSFTAGEMFSAWVEHDNLHIRQLVEIRHARIARLAKPYDVRYAGEW
jgi:hypothetical protein